MEEQQGLPRRGGGLPGAGRVAHNEKQADTLRGFVDDAHRRLGVFRARQGPEGASIVPPAKRRPSAGGEAESLACLAKPVALPATTPKLPTPAVEEHYPHRLQQKSPSANWRNEKAVLLRNALIDTSLGTSWKFRTPNSFRSKDLHCTGSWASHGGFPPAHYLGWRTDHFLHPEQRLPRPLTRQPTVEAVRHAVSAAVRTVLQAGDEIAGDGRRRASARRCAAQRGTVPAANRRSQALGQAGC